MEEKKEKEPTTVQAKVLEQGHIESAAGDPVIITLLHTHCPSCVRTIAAAEKDSEKVHCICGAQVKLEASDVSTSVPGKAA